jgi:hypothetical protein
LLLLYFCQQLRLQFDELLVFCFSLGPLLLEVNFVSRLNWLGQIRHEGSLGDGWNRVKERNRGGKERWSTRKPRAGGRDFGGWVRILNLHPERGPPETSFFGAILLGSLKVICS